MKYIVPKSSTDEFNQGSLKYLQSLQSPQSHLGHNLHIHRNLWMDNLHNLRIRRDNLKRQNKFDYESYVEL